MTPELAPQESHAQFRALYDQIPTATEFKDEAPNVPSSGIEYLISFFANAERRADSEHLQVLTSRFTGLLRGAKITQIFRYYLVDELLKTYRVGKKQYSVEEVDEDIYHSEEAQRDLLFRMYRGDMTSDGLGIFGEEGSVYEMFAFNMEYDRHMTFVSISQGLSYRPFKMHRRELDFTLEHEKRPEELGADTDLATRREHTKKFRKDLKKERRGLKRWAEEFKVLHGGEMPIFVEKEYPYSDL